jgi:hypothetical protein
MASPVVHVQADLEFTSTPADGSPGVAGRITADGRTIDVTVSGPIGVGGASAGRLGRQLGASLARRHLRLVVNGPQGMIVTLGDVRASWWQRLVTRSRHIQLGSLGEVRRFSSGGLRGQRGGSPAFLPPLPLSPLFPTVSTLGPRPVTTTHDPRGGGMPRLYFALSEWPKAGEVKRVEYLTKPHTTIGSSSDCDIQIDGLEPLHAVIDRTDDDEYVLTHVAASGTSLVASKPAQRGLLRTGTAVELGSTRLTYFREEYADHGRPYGGRIGGELGRQRPQPRPRPASRGSAGRPRTNRDPGRYYPK